MYLNLFLLTSLCFGTGMAVYMALSDPFFHYNHDTVVRTLVAYCAGGTFGFSTVAQFWLLRRKHPNMISFSPWQQRTILFNGSISQAHEVSQRTLSDMKVRDYKFNSDYKLVAKTARGYFTNPFGEQVELLFRPTSDFQTEIVISSSPRVIKSILDNGAGWRNVDTIANSLENTKKVS